MADRSDRPEQIDDPVLIAAARHALHDEELVAAFAVDGKEAEDPERARALIARCTTCRDLYADLVAIGSTIRATATAQALGSVRAAPGDFRLTPMDAARLQPGNLAQRAAARLLAGAAMFGRPVGASLATFGLVGLLVGTMGLGQLTVGALPQSEGTTAGAAAGPAASPAPAPGAAASAAPAPGSTADAFGVLPPASQATDQGTRGPLASAERQEGETTAMASETGAGTGAIQLLFAGSILLLVLGVALLFTGYRHARAWARARQRT